jgi:glucosamine--fructose-6-phosphate aminotransferase (isomerizing)
MCGIIGYIGESNAFPFLLEGLKKLEYRGYDSAGIAVLSNELCIQKNLGKLKEITFREVNGAIGIAHVRWATHGKVSVENAHPHLDCKKEIAVVHNGIFENYRELKNYLSTMGHIFNSETDSEVAAHLIEEFMLQGFSFEEAIVNAVKMLQGSFTLLVMKQNEQKIGGARKGTRSLILGVSEKGFFPASDVLAFLEWTNHVVYLKSGDVFFADNRGGLRIYNIDDASFVDRPRDILKYSIDAVKKGEFEHLMLREISEQDETILRALKQDEQTIFGIVEKIRHAGGTFFVGCGSSYHACLAGSYMFSKLAKVHVNVVLASEFENYEHFLTDRSLIFAISQSGETADVLDAVTAAKRRGSRVVGIINREGSILARESDYQLFMNSGPEICVLSTKTYTSQLVLMNLLAYALADKYQDGVEKLGHLYVDIYNLTSRTMREYLTKLARILVTSKDIYLMGRGAQYTTALEAALKIKEVSYIHAEAFAGGEIKHGTLALIENGVPCIVFVSHHDSRDKILSNAEEVKSRGGYIIGVGSEKDEIFDFWIKVPEAGELNPIIQIIPMQILAYQLAVLKGLDPDKPRNLAKCVTVT